MKSNLMLHCGGMAVDRGQLALVPLPPRTKSFVPISHDRLVTGVQSALVDAGLRVVSEAHGLSHLGQRYFGLLQLTNGEDDADFALTVGIRNSHDMRFPAGLCVGASVFICDNLSFSSEVRLARKHTVHIERDLPQLIGLAVGQLGDLRRRQDTRFAAYKNHELSEAEAHDLLIRALDARVLPVTSLPGALKEWRTPRHPEFVKQGKTAWRMFNAVTEELKGNLDLLPRRTMALHGLLDMSCGLVGEAQTVQAS